MASGPSAPQAHRVVWSVDLGTGAAFHPYDARVTALLEARHGSGIVPAVFKSSVGRHDYTFDLTAMTQTNDSTGFARAIHRDLVVVPVVPPIVRRMSPTIDFTSVLHSSGPGGPSPGAAGDVAPTFAYWAPEHKRHIRNDGHEASYSLVPVEHGSPEWSAVVSALGSTLVTVVTVDRIQNLQLARGLRSEIRHLQELLDDDRTRGAPALRVSTRLAWHGTRDRDNVHFIAEEGLLVQTNGANYYGHGAYTAPKSIDTSHPVYTNADPDFVPESDALSAAIGTAEVFQALLVVVITDGKLDDYPCGDSGMLTPPKRSSPAVTRHFGTTNGGSNPAVLVTYSKHMTMPQYLVRICNSKDMAAPMPAAPVPAAAPTVPAAAVARPAAPAPPAAALARPAAPVPSAPVLIPAPVPAPAAPALARPAAPLAPVPSAPVLIPAPAAPAAALPPLPHPAIKRTADDMLGASGCVGTSSGSAPLPMAPPVPVATANTTRTWVSTSSTTTTSTTTSSTSSTSSTAAVARPVLDGAALALRALAAVLVGARVRMRLKGYGEHSGTIVDIARQLVGPATAKCTVDWDDGTTSKVSSSRCAAHLIAAAPAAHGPAPLVN